MGQSVNIKARWSDYRGLFCSHQRSLIASFKKYGVDDHVFGILYRCPKEKLNEAEEYFVNAFNACDNRYGMNLKLGGGSRAGVSEETREKIRRGSIGKNKGRKMSPEAIERMRQTKLAQHIRISDEMKKRISEKLKGRKLTEEHKRNVGNALRGKKRGPLSEEHKRRIAEANKNKKRWSDEQRAKMIEARKGKPSPLKGRKYSEEWKKNRKKALTRKPMPEGFGEKISKARKGVPWTRARRESDYKKRFKYERILLPDQTDFFRVA